MREHLTPTSKTMAQAVIVDSVDLVEAYHSVSMNSTIVH